MTDKSLLGFSLYQAILSNAGVMKFGLMRGGKLALVLNQTSTTSRAQTLVQLYNPQNHKI